MRFPSELYANVSKDQSQGQLLLQVTKKGTVDATKTCRWRCLGGKMNFILNRLDLWYWLNIQIKILNRLLDIPVLSLRDRPELEIKTCWLWHEDRTGWLHQGNEYRKRRKKEEGFKSSNQWGGRKPVGRKGKCPVSQLKKMYPRRGAVNYGECMIEQGRIGWELILVIISKLLFILIREVSMKHCGKNSTELKRSGGEGLEAVNRNNGLSTLTIKYTSKTW